MLVTLNPNAEPSRVQARLQALGLWTQRLDARGRPVAFLVESHSAYVPLERIASVEGVEEVCAPPSAHPRVDELCHRPVAIGKLLLGEGAPPVLMAGPCSVESPEQISHAAEAAARAGARLLRGGAFKPRTSPYSFAGHGRAALAWLRGAADRHGLGVVTEVMSEREVEAVAEIADLMQVGSRNMQNFALLRAVGAANKPVLLKRGMAATIDEWLLAGEHLLAAGASGVVFCERGVHGFDPFTRNLLDLGAVALLGCTLGLPVIADPSHGAGRRDLIAPLARAAMAAGAHGLLVEFHPDPGAAKSDGPQALDPRELEALAEECMS
ncbi:MAG TPA: 3-deoxy-7-phosphoheptulonate synthase [Polyangiaceae bacterium]|nr:3-deoxy-7-phosphoheptulonate synthase [Polyangiaceae bacterium]